MKRELFTFPNGVEGVIIWRSEDGTTIGVRTKRKQIFTTHLITTEKEGWDDNPKNKRFLKQLTL